MRTTRSDDEFNRELSELLRAEGISRLGVAEIAERLRCSRRRLYQVAATKEGLLTAVVEENFAQVLKNGVEAAGSKTTAKERVLAYLGAGSSMAATWSEAFLRDVLTLPEARAAFDRFQAMRAAGLRDLIEDGVRQGEFAPCDSRIVAEVALGAALRLRRPEFLESAGLTLQEAFEQAWVLIVNGMLRGTR